MDRVQKEELVASMHRAFAETSMVVVAHYSGMTVAQLTDLRARMRESGARFQVTKNRLTRLALEGTDYEGLREMFTGPTAIAYSADPVAAAKTTVEFAKKNDKLVVVGGALGTQVLDAEGVKALASLPSLDELRARVIGLINAPATKLATVLQVPAGDLARVFAAYGEKGEAA